MNRRLLVVEDNKDMCRVISDVFEDGDFSVCTVHDGETGLQRLKEEDYDLLILDYRLPGKNGNFVLEQARQIKSSLPVVMISAYGYDARKSGVMKKGVSEFLDKPFSLDTLTAAVEKALGRKV